MPRPISNRSGLRSARAPKGRPTTKRVGATVPKGRPSTGRIQPMASTQRKMTSAQRKASAIKRNARSVGTAKSLAKSKKIKQYNAAVGGGTVRKGSVNRTTSGPDMPPKRPDMGPGGKIGEAVASFFDIGNFLKSLGK